MHFTRVVGATPNKAWLGFAVCRWRVLSRLTFVPVLLCSLSVARALTVNACACALVSRWDDNTQWLQTSDSFDVDRNQPVDVCLTVPADAAWALLRV